VLRQAPLLAKRERPASALSGMFDPTEFEADDAHLRRTTSKTPIKSWANLDSPSESESEVVLKRRKALSRFQSAINVVMMMILAESSMKKQAQIRNQCFVDELVQLGKEERAKGIKGSGSNQNAVASPLAAAALRVAKRYDGTTTALGEGQDQSS